MSAGGMTSLYLKLRSLNCAASPLPYRSSTPAINYVVGVLAERGAIAPQATHGTSSGIGWTDLALRPRWYAACPRPLRRGPSYVSTNRARPGFTCAGAGDLDCASAGSGGQAVGSSATNVVSWGCAAHYQRGTIPARAACARIVVPSKERSWPQPNPAA